MTVPPAESIVKLPDEVSISPSAVCPTLILPDANPVNVPSPNTTLPAEPENTSVLFVASGINVNVLALSSKPKNPNLADEPSWYLNSKPLSLLSSELVLNHHPM